MKICQWLRCIVCVNAFLSGKLRCRERSLSSQCCSGPICPHALALANWNSPAVVNLDMEKLDVSSLTPISSRCPRNNSSRRYSSVLVRLGDLEGTVGALPSPQGQPPTDVIEYRSYRWASTISNRSSLLNQQHCNLQPFPTLNLLPA